MKSKITRIPPDELQSIKLQNAKKILQKDIATLESLGEEAAVSFFINTNFTYQDKASKVLPLLILSEFKGAWKDHVRKETKPPAKFGLTGSCTYSFDPKTKTRFLNLSITKGKPKSKIVENFIYKSKILPSDVKLNFKENHILEADEAVTALDAAEEIKKDILYKKIFTKTKEYKAIPLENGSDRIDSIDKILKIIAKWNQKHLPINKEDKEGLEREDKLKKLEKQLQDHRINIHIRSRKGEPIDSIKKNWSTYKARIIVDDSNILADLEDRLDTLNDLLEDIDAWKNRNPAPFSEKEQILINALNILEEEVKKELEKLKKSLPKVRVESIRLMLDEIKKASPEELKKLKDDSIFMWELSRSVPVAQMNDTRKLLGLPPVEEEEDIEPFPSNEEAWKDPEILAVFNDFAKFTKFELETDHKANPKLKKKVELLKGTWVWEDGKTIADKFQLDVDTTFKLDSEDSKGNLKLIVTVKGKNKIFYALKKDVAKETDYQVLDPKTKLFPTPPSKNHVKQGGLGDCYLLATVISLVSRDPQFIQDMMLDKGDTVTVRLFEVSIAKDGTQSFKAKYFNVDKSIPKDPDGSDAYARDYLWVQMLEKAYAAGNFGGSTSKLVQYIKDNKHEGYKDIAGGYLSFANQILTGKAGERLTFKLNSVSDNKDFAVTGVPINQRGKIGGSKGYEYKHLPWGVNEKNYFKAAGPNYSKTVSHKIFNKNKTNMLIWWKFVKKGSIDRLFSREFFDDYSGEVTLEDLDLIFQGKMQNAKGEEVKGLPVLKKSIATIMLDWLKKEKLYPGKRGAGIYSVLQLNMFKEIKEALDNKKLVGLTSKVKVGLSVDAKGHSAGESISGGLAGNHVYSVLTAREIAPTKELELRNPWGHTVQKNMTIADAVKDLSHNINNVLLHEIKALTPNVTKLKLEHLTALTNYKAEKNKAKKEELKKLVDLKAKEYGDAEQVILDMKDPKKLTSFEGKITNKHAAYYDKKVPLLAKLKKQDQTKLISKTATQSDEVGQESGEFWLLLDDLNKRFRSICIG